MPQTHQDEHTFNHNWKETVEGAFHKYPNDLQSDVLSIDVLSRKIDKNGNLITDKLNTSRFSIPAVSKCLRSIGMHPAMRQISLESSVLNLTKKSYYLKSLNSTYYPTVSVYEQLNYTQDPEDLNRTKLKQLTISNSTFSMIIDNAIISLVKSNMGKGRMALNNVISNIKAEYLILEEFIQCQEKMILDKISIAHKLFDETTDDFCKYSKESLNLIEEKCKEIQNELNQVAIDFNQNVKQQSTLIEETVIEFVEEAFTDIEKITKIGVEDIQTMVENSLLNPSSHKSRNFSFSF